MTVVQMQKWGHVRFNSATGKPTAPPEDESVNEMAVLDLIHGGMHRDNIAGNGAIAKFLANARNHMARRAVYRQTLRELGELSNRELADLGLSRSNIRSVAYEAAWGSK